MSDWRTIDSAPRDGTWIIAFNSQGVFPCAWCEEPDYDDYRGWSAAGSGYGGALYSLHNGVFDNPTHWMPLPAPPEAE